SLQIERIQELLGPFRMLQNFLSQESAVSEYGDQVAQPNRRACQAVKRSRVLLAQPREVMQSLLRCGRSRQQEVKTVLNGRGQMRRKRRELAGGSRLIPVGERRQAVHEKLRGFV